MARSTVEEPFFEVVGRVVLGADRVVGAQPAKLQGVLQVALDVPPHLYQATEGALGAGSPGVLAP